MIEGHRSVGGCRASLYNGMPMEGKLVSQTRRRTILDLQCRMLDVPIYETSGNQVLNSDMDSLASTRYGETGAGMIFELSFES